MMLKREYDFHIYLQYKDKKSVNKDIVKVDIVNSVIKYSLKGGPDNPIRYMEMEVDRQTIIDTYPGIIDNIVEGETRLIVDAVDSGTFIISKIWLDGQTYELIALGSESVIRGTLLTAGFDNMVPSSIAEEVYNIWEYSSNWNNDYTPTVHYSRDKSKFQSNTVSINNEMPTGLGLQLCALADDAFAFFGNTFIPSRIKCQYATSGKYPTVKDVKVNERFYYELEYESYLDGRMIRVYVDYIVESVDKSKHTCILRCVGNSNFGDLSTELRKYLVREYGNEGRVYLCRIEDKEQEFASRRKVEYTTTTTYAHYQDCLHYVRYADIQSVNPDTHYPDRDGEINLYGELDDYNRRYSDFDRLMFEKASEVSYQNADASSTVINRQEMLYYDTAKRKEGEQEVEIGLSNIENTNGLYQTGSGTGASENPYYSGGIPSIETYGIHEGVYLMNAYFKYRSTIPGVNTVQKIVNNIVRRYRDPPQSITFTIKESKLDEFGYLGWERMFDDFAYANKINDEIHGIYLTNSHRCDGAEDKALLRVSSYVRHYPEMTTTYTFGGTRESGLSQMIADINTRTEY